MALTNSQYKTIERSYEHIRDYNRAQSETRKREIRRLLPQYEQLEDSVSTLSLQAARALLSGDDTATDTLHSKLADIRARQNTLLTEAGFPQDYLEPIYDCPFCHDTGYIAGENGLKEKCNCFRQKEIALLYENSNLIHMIATENFSALSTEYYQGEDLQHFETAVTLCKDFVKDFSKSYHNILFYGTVGTGKSFLSGCIANELIQQNYSVVYFSASVLFDTLTGYSYDAEAKKALAQLTQDLYNCDLLIIDDLGAELPNALRNAQLFALLNERFLHKKSIIISTNLGLSDLQSNYSDRIFSRFTSYFSLCKLTGPDIRIQKKRLANAKLV